MLPTTTGRVSPLVVSVTSDEVVVVASVVDAELTGSASEAEEAQLDSTKQPPASSSAPFTSCPPVAGCGAAQRSTSLPGTVAATLASAGERDGGRASSERDSDEWGERDSNPRPTACKAVALPTELYARERNHHASGVWRAGPPAVRVWPRPLRRTPGRGAGGPPGRDRADPRSRPPPPGRSTGRP